MKYSLFTVSLLGLLLWSCSAEKARKVEPGNTETFTVYANKAYAEPFTPHETGVSVPVGWPETKEVVSQWSDPNKSVVWYLYMKEGSYDFLFDQTTAAEKSQKFHLNVSSCYDLGFQPIDKELTFESKSAPTDTLFAARIEAPKTGYYRYELKPLTDPESAVTIHNLIFNEFDPEKTGQVNHTDYQSSPSVHLSFSTTAETTRSYDWIYQEILVPEGADPLATYYMSLGFFRGYMGIQTNSAEERRVLFSVWDSKDAENDKSIGEDDFVSLVDKDEATTTNSFGGEGTGGQSYVKTANWKTGKPVQFLMNVRKSDKNSIVLSAWYNVDNQGWKYVASWRAPKESRMFDGFYSFLENYGYTNGQLRREAYYYNAWGREDATGNWVNFNKVRFSNTDGKEGQRVDFEQGVSPDFPDRFYMSSGGYTPTVKTADEIPLSDKTPEIDLNIFTKRVDQALQNETRHKDQLKNNRKK